MNANRPDGWKANPQALAMVSAGRQYDGHPELGKDFDADTWLTPRWILDYLGAFDLDPAATDAEPHRCAPRSFVKADNGLLQEWAGRVWLNPPFSDTRPWIERHSLHADGITLVPAAVESKVWRACVWTRAKAVMLLHGRTRFCAPDGGVTIGRPLRPVALIAWSDFDRQVLTAAPFAGVLLTEWGQR